MTILNSIYLNVDLDHPVACDQCHAPLGDMERQLRDSLSAAAPQWMGHRTRPAYTGMLGLRSNLQEISRRPSKTHENL